MKCSQKDNRFKIFCLCIMLFVITLIILAELSPEFDHKKSPKFKYIAITTLPGGDVEIRYDIRGTPEYNEDGTIITFQDFNTFKWLNYPSDKIKIISKDDLNETEK